MSIFIAFGGNLGDVYETFVQARTDLQSKKNCKVLASSSIYQSKAVGGPEQNDYLNAVIKLQTCESPETLLQRLLQIELEHGRERLEHWGPRSLDLDLLAYGNVIQSSPTLILPHPRLCERLFVLQPMLDIAPQWQHPFYHQSIKNIHQNLLQTDHVQRIHLHHQQW